MRNMLDRATLLTMGTAFAVALFFAWPREYHGLLLYIPFRALLTGDVLFHEMGHAGFHWVFGHPAIPGIMSLFGQQIASGYTIYFDHNWIFHGMVIAAMGYGCWWLRENRPAWFWPTVIFLTILSLFSFTRYNELFGIYMGHAGSIFCGGVLLYRAWSNIIVTSSRERWFNAVFGFFIVLNNAAFAYQLLFANGYQEEYTSHELAEDFSQMVDLVPYWTINGIAKVTMAYAFVTLLGSFLLAAYFYEDEHYSDA